MLLNGDEFQLFLYRINKEIKRSTEYHTETNTFTSWKSNVKDLRVIMSEDLTFSEHNRATVASSIKMTGWILLKSTT